MTREDAKIAAQIMLDYANGGELQNWSDVLDKYVSAPFATFNWCDKVKQYRIKPKSEYVPFETAEECLEEMYKHEPFGKIFSNSNYEYQIICVAPNKIFLSGEVKGSPFTFKEAFKRFKFWPETPFGKEIIND